MIEAGPKTELDGDKWSVAHALLEKKSIVSCSLTNNVKELHAIYIMHHKK